MSTFLKVLDADLNFWEVNPNFKTIREFRHLMTTDKSKGKVNSSRIMWAIAFYKDQNIENVWRNEDENDKQALLAEDIIGDKKFDWSTVEDLLYAYEEKVMSKPEKDVAKLEAKIRERQKFIDNTKYTLDSYDDKGKLVKGTADQLDKMVVGTNKIYQQLQELKAIYEKSEEEGHVRGGRTESASEQGLI